MIDVWKTLKDRIQGKAPKGTKRSKYWRRTRKQVLRERERCEICGSKKKLEVHHIIPFHIAPDLELRKDNLLVLCENKKYGINCHLLVGHLGNYRKINPEAVLDTTIWRRKIKGALV